MSYINYLGWLYVGVVNQQVLRSFAVQGQTEAVDLHASLQEAHQNVSAMRLAVQTGDKTLAQQKQQGLIWQRGCHFPGGRRQPWINWTVCSKPIARAQEMLTR